MTVALPTARRNAGAIAGTITFSGTPPKMRPIDMAKEPILRRAARRAHYERKRRDRNRQYAIGNVVVYISAGDQPGRAPTAAVRYDQKGCEYIPHVAVMQAGQPLEIYNNDQDFP